jgi:GNAT superfamily N-acetyltransferase
MRQQHVYLASKELGSMDISQSQQVTLDHGYSHVPAGCIASVATFLEMVSPPVSFSSLGDVVLERLRGDSAHDYRTLFAKIGAPWLWFSRLALRISELEQLLDHPDIMAFAAIRDGRSVGLVEVDFRQEGEAELAFFGLVPDAIGTRLGRPLIDAGLKLAWSRPIRHVMVHTCTLDHPRALNFYEKIGFKPYKRAVEIAQDPRLTGLLPLDCVPHVPIVRA